MLKGLIDEIPGISSDKKHWTWFEVESPKGKNKLWEGMIRELIKDMVKYLSSYIAPALVGLIAVPILTRLFPPEEYRLYV